MSHFKKSWQVVQKCLHTRYGFTFWVLLHVVKNHSGGKNTMIKIIDSFLLWRESFRNIVRCASQYSDAGFWILIVFYTNFHLLHNWEISLKWAFSRMYQNPSNTNLAFLLVCAMGSVFKVSNEYSTRAYSLLFWLYRITPKLSRIQMVHYILIEC